MTTKYSTNDPYTDSNGVLVNKLGISSDDLLQKQEVELLLWATDELYTTYLDTHQFSEIDIQVIHRTWLGPLFDWAGEYRTVDISSEDIRWCHAQYIESEMRRVGDLLKSWTPLALNISKAELVTKLAHIHGELIIIHPFRDGNGRAARVLMNLMLLQSGREPVSHHLGNDQLRHQYHHAIRAVWSKSDYGELESILNGLLDA